MNENEEDRDKPATGREKFVWYCALLFATVLLIADILIKLSGGYGLSPEFGGFLFYPIIVIVWLLGIARLKGWIQKGGDKGVS